MINLWDTNDIKANVLRSMLKSWKRKFFTGFLLAWDEYPNGKCYDSAMRKKKQAEYDQTLKELHEEYPFIKCRQEPFFAYYVDFASLFELWQAAITPKSTPEQTEPSYIELLEYAGII